MDRIQSITDALEIIGAARVAVYGKSPAAWEYLWHVTRYLTDQQMEAFREICSPNEGFSAVMPAAGETGGDSAADVGVIAGRVSEADQQSRSRKEAESQFDAAVGSKSLV
jgi:hypothetical protein